MKRAARQMARIPEDIVPSEFQPRIEGVKEALEDLDLAHLLVPAILGSLIAGITTAGFNFLLTRRTTRR
jgi:hypothetical protein